MVIWLPKFYKRELPMIQVLTGSHLAVCFINY